MSQAISNPALAEHIAPCGLFCTNCRKFKMGKCKGCQIEPGFGKCSVRLCCIEKKITTCAECGEFTTLEDYVNCKKLNNFIAKVFSFLFGSNRPAALALLRSQGRDAFIAAKKAGGKM